MAAAPRSRFFNNNNNNNNNGRYGARDVEADQNMDRRVVSTGRRERRRRRRPVAGSNRDWFPLLLRRLSRLIRRRRALVLLVLVACVTTSKLLGWAARSSDVSLDVVEGGIHQRPSPPSLGPDAIPSVVLVDGRRSVLSSHGSGPVGSDRKRKQPGFGEAESDGERGGCRNTVQGMTLLADSEGRVCPREERDPLRPGCCAARTWSQEAPLLEQGGAEVEAWLSPASRAAAAGVADGGFPPEEAFSTVFSCWSCDTGEGGSSCCRSYEFCVSCCQDPSRADEREVFRAAAALSGHPAYHDFGDNGDLESPGLLLRAGGGGGEEEERQREARRDAFAYCAFRCRTYSGSVAHENSFRGPLKHCFGRFQPPTALESSIGRSGTRSRGESLRGGDEERTRGGLQQGRAGSPLQLDPLVSRFISDKKIRGR